MKTVLVACVLSIPALASADPLPPLAVQAQAPEKTDSVNLSPLGVLVGNYAVTYEHLWNGSHGLILEGDLGRSSSNDASSLQYGGAVGYRWHWSGKQNSGFLGLMFAQGVGNGSVTETTNGQTMKYDMSVKSTTLTANIGKRWMITPEVNITFRLGLGWGHYSAEAKDSTPDAKNAEKTMNDLLAFLPIGFDGELSAGYTF